MTVIDFVEKEIIWHRSSFQRKEKSWFIVLLDIDNCALENNPIDVKFQQKCYRHAEQKSYKRFTLKLRIE